MLVEIENIRGGYGTGDVLRGISCGADGGEVLALVGPNGCGKTTLFRVLLGICRPSGGEIRLDGAPLAALKPRELARLVAYIPQQHNPAFDYTVLDMVLMGRAGWGGVFSSPKKRDREAALSALEKLGMADAAPLPYTRLSGGQRQMALIARALCQDAKILLMDEPGANLDFANHHRIMALAGELAKKGYCVLFSTHSPEYAFSPGHKALLLREGRAVAFGPPREVATPENLEKAYGIPMDIVEVTDSRGEKRLICLPLSP